MKRGATGLIVAMLLAACSPRSPRADLVFIQSAEPETLDPALVTDQVSMRLSEALFEGLCRVNEKGEPLPGVAETWDVSADKKHYTFHLRANSRWSNGEPVVAEDFVYSWRRALDPVLGADYASQLYLVKNAKAYNEGKIKDATQIAVKATDSRTLDVDLENPTPYFIDMCAFLTLAPVHRPTLEKHGSAWIKPGNIVTNGAYLIDDWKLDDHIRLRRNADYWDAANVKLASVEVKPIQEANTALNYFINGQADLIMDKGMIPASLVGKLKQQPWFRTVPFLGTWFVRFNVTKAPFNDLRVRQAFAMAVDKKRIVEKITQLGEHPAFSLTPPGCGRDYQPPPGLEFDPIKARALLSEAGFPNGKGLPRVEYLYIPLGVEKNIAVELQAMWQDALGVEVGLVKQEQKIWLSSMRSLSYDMCRSSWIGDYNDPNTFLDMFTTGNGNNRTGFARADYDKLIVDAAAEADPVKRYAIFQQAEKILITDDCAIIPGYYYVGPQLYHADKLGGVQGNMIDLHPFRCMFWK